MTFKCGIIALTLLIISSGLVGCLKRDVEWTPAELVIFDANITNVTTSTARVTWKTNTPAISNVVFMHEESVSNTVFSPDLVTDHQIDLMNLEPSRWYMLIIHSTNGQGGSSLETGQTMTFQTREIPAADQ